MRTSKDGQLLIDFITLHGKEQLANSLTQTYNWILFDSSLTIDEHKKDVLHDVIILAKQIQRLENKPPLKKRRKLFKRLR